jgi:hypothetical protein
LPSPTFAFPVSSPAETTSPGKTPTHSLAAPRSPHSKRKP